MNINGGLREISTHGRNITDFASFSLTHPRAHPARSSNENVGRKSRVE